MLQPGKVLEPQKSKLTRLKVEFFRGVEPGTELHFSDGWNVVLGKNGSGKTTLLRILTSILRSDFSDFILEEFHFEFEIAADVGATIVCNVHNQPAKTSEELAKLVDASKRGGHASFDLLVRVDIKLREHRWVVNAERGVIKRDDEPIEARRGGVTYSWLLPSLLLSLIPGEDFSSDPVWPVLVSVFTISDSLVLFDEALGAFNALVTPAETEVGRWYPSPSAFVTRPEPPNTNGEIMVNGSFLLPELLAAITVKANGAPNHAQDLFLSEIELPLLREVAPLFRFKSAHAVVTFKEKNVQDNRSTFHYGPLSFLFQTTNDSVFRHDQLSYGQKRMLAFMYFARANPYFVIADELVNGLHHEWIGTAIQAMGDKQKFLTSQNPLLLDYLEFASEAEVRATFVRCSSDGDVTHWANFSEGEAARFYAAYVAGIQQVGEILRMESLW